MERKENLWRDYQARKEEGIFNENEEEIPSEFTARDERKKNEAIKEGFPKWTKKDFVKFLRASEIYGLDDYENLSKSMKSKTSSEIEEYVKVFKARIDELPNGQRIMSRINKFESEKNKVMEYQELLNNLFNELSDKYDDIYSNLEIPYKVKTKSSAM